MSLCPNIKSNMTTREVLFEFWREHSKEASLEEMVFEKDAEDVCPIEKIEILSLLGDVKGKNVLELGSGIGRFTGTIASEAKHVTCIDFMESFVLKNKETNGHMENITFFTADVTKQEFEPDSFDIVFSNWILQYLTDDEVNELLVNVIKWTKPGGKIFFRESCFKMRGKPVFVDDSNPTHYRKPSAYCDMFQQAKSGTPPMGLELVFCRNLKCYIELKKTYFQCCWLLQTTGHQDNVTCQQILDTKPYSTNDILMLERVYGTGFIGGGGKESIEEFAAMMDLKPDQKVLIVGSGIGGGAFHIAQKYDVEVLGIDSSINMVELAMERTPTGTKIQFQICDVTKVEFDAGSFDVIYSKDTMVDIDEKLPVYKKFVNWLKPGGKLLLSGYCQSNGEHSDGFKTHLARRTCNFPSIEQCSKMLEEAGFVKVKADDRSKKFADILKRERMQTEASKDAFIKDFSEEDYNVAMTASMDLLRYFEIGDQTRGLFCAERPHIM